MPPEEEFSDCLHKIKSGFNLLVCVSIYTVTPCHCVCPLHALTDAGVVSQGELNGKINNPAAPDFVHSLFSALAFVSDFIFINFSVLWHFCLILEKVAMR